MDRVKRDDSITIQSIIFHTPADRLESALASIDAAAVIGVAEGLHGSVGVSYGDCSPSPSLTTSQLDAWREKFPSLTIDYEFFGENLGHGGGQNRLAVKTSTDLLVIGNPDVIPAAKTLGHLVDVMADATVGIVEAKQLPLEHPKDYDKLTGATGWASGAFSMFRTAQFLDIGGFDHESFFMYGDDVDLSWRFRARGFRIIFQPAAIVFHDKRLTLQGDWSPTTAERYYSAESALLLAYKWSRDDILENLLVNMAGADDESIQGALAEFTRRRDSGALPVRMDPTNSTAEFTKGNYAAHRW